MLQKMLPSLAHGAMIVADDVNLFPEMLHPYLTYVRDPANGFTSCELPLDDGVELSLSF